MRALDLSLDIGWNWQSICGTSPFTQERFSASAKAKQGTHHSQEVRMVRICQSPFPKCPSQPMSALSTQVISGLCSLILNHCWLETWAGKLHWGSAWICSSWNLQGRGYTLHAGEQMITIQRWTLKSKHVSKPLSMIRENTFESWYINFHQFPSISINQCPSNTYVVLPGFLRWLIQVHFHFQVSFKLHLLASFSGMAFYVIYVAKHNTSMLVQFWRPAEPFSRNWHPLTGLWTMFAVPWFKPLGTGETL